MTRDSDQRVSSSDDGRDDLRLTRRAAMAVLGVGAAAGVSSGAAAAADAGSDDGVAANHNTGNGKGQTRKWNQHVNAQLHDLENVRDFSSKTVQTKNLFNESRDAEVVVWRDGSGIYHADSRKKELVRTMDFREAVQTAIDSLDDDRTEKQKVVVACSGTLGPHEWDGDVLAIEVPSYITLDFRGTIYVEDEGEALVRPLRAKQQEEIEIPRVRIEGNFRSAIWFKGVRNVTIGHIDIRTAKEDLISGTGGGVRIDAGRDVLDEPWESRDIHVDSCYIEGTAGHAFETYNVRRLSLGRVIAKNIGNYEGTGGAGVLLNSTYDSTVGQVIGKDIDNGGGYAAFRVANGAHDVTCGQVVCNGGARGVFGVSACHDITIGEVNLRELDANGVLIQDNQRFNIEGGVVRDCFGEAIRVDSRSSQRHPPAEAVSVTDVRVVDTRDEKQQTYGIRETGPNTGNNRFVDNDLRDAGTDANMAVFNDSTVVRDNIAGGVAMGTVTLTSGSSPAARVAGVSGNAAATLDLRAKTRNEVSAAYSWDHHFEWTGKQWDLVIEWGTDPGQDIDLDYIVDQPQANIGESPTIPPVTYEGPISAGNYRLNAVHSGLALETADPSASPGTNVQQGAWEGAAHQKWTLVALDSGDKHFRIENMASGAVLEVADGSTEDAANVQVGEWSGADHQRWIVEEYQEGHYAVRAVHSGKALNVAGVSQEDGGNVVQWPYGGEGAGNELWDFEEVARNLNTSPGMVESFEDGNLDEYRGQTGSYEVAENGSAPDGSMVLEGNSGFGGSIEGKRIWTNDVDRHIVPGVKFSARIGWDSNNANACVAFGAVDSDSAAEGDAFPFNFIRLYQEGEDDWRFQFYTRNGTKAMAKTIGETSEDSFYEVVVDWGTDGTFNITLNDSGGNELYTTELTGLGEEETGTDFGVGTRGTGYLDAIQILEDNTGS